ncbi:phosphatase PAP2 family protein [Luteibacter aegosomatissinici]|nr:phosphatase PAP2 family protein [Luteibacter aegosomatissinici]UPG96538.1 phosphatase PAP2 family protein [Luteibacter aegosomatissinici]
MRALGVRSALLLILAIPLPAMAGGGPFGIDHRVSYDNSGIWKRSNQNILRYGTILTVGLGALALGDNDKEGDTFWRAVDSTIMTVGATTVMKYTFRRERPSRTDDPDQWFKGGSQNHSFPSGEVALISAAVTPFIVNYREDHPWVYALALLPAYDAVARVKVRGHWQSDVLVGAALGTTIGIWSSRRTESPIVLSWLPGGFRVGFIHHFR